MFSMKRTFRQVIVLSLVLIFFIADAYANDITRIEKVIEIPGSVETTEQFRKLYLSWASDTKTNIDEIVIKDSKDNILFSKRRFVPKQEEIVERKILTYHSRAVLVEKYLIKDTHKPATETLNRLLKRVVERIEGENLIKQEYNPVYNNYSIVLWNAPLGLYWGKEYSAERYIILGEIPDDLIENLSAGEYGLLTNAIHTYDKKACIIEVPVIKDYPDDSGDLRMFYFWANKKPFKYYDPPKGGFPDYRRYAEFLKKILFNLDLDKMINSGKYKGKDLEMLKRCKKQGMQYEGEGIVTNIDSIIMWTAFRTEDIDYIEKTYDELQKFRKKKPKYLVFYLEDYEGIAEPLLLNGTTIKEIIKNLKKLRGGK